MNKKVKYALNGAGIGAAIGFLINAICQFLDMNDEDQKDFDWSEALSAAGKGALLGGGVGLLAGAYCDNKNAKVVPKDTDNILKREASKISLQKQNPRFVRTNKKAIWLENVLNQQFFHQLQRYPKRIGSVSKGTALNKHFDIDTSLLFRSSSFSSTHEMSSAVFDFLLDLKSSGRIYDVRLQKKSIGVFFNTASELIKIDVVPCKLTSREGNVSSGYLRVMDQNMFGMTVNTYKKTDVYALTSQHYTQTQKNIILLLKNWKLRNNIPISSHLLENLVVDAYQFNRGKIPAGFTDKLIMVVEHISENLEGLELASVENTNNIITDISRSKKFEIIEACNSLIEDYTYQPNSILDHLTG